MPQLLSPLTESQIVSQLRAAGFEPGLPASRPRLIISVEGAEKSGKTHFAASAPGPIFYQGVDIGHEGVLDKFPGKAFFPRLYDFDIPLTTNKNDPQAVAAYVSTVWERFVSDYRRALEAGARTIIWDTAGEVWEFCRMARLGKLTQVMPMSYGPVNAEFRDLIRLAFDHDSNLILLHKSLDEWENIQTTSGEKGRKTGRKKRKGFAEIGFLVQVNVQTRFAPGHQMGTMTIPPAFYVDILETRLSPELMGKSLVNPTFAQVAGALMPWMPASHWA